MSITLRGIVLVALVFAAIAVPTLAVTAAQQAYETPAATGGTTTVQPLPSGDDVAVNPSGGVVPVQPASQPQQLQETSGSLPVTGFEAGLLAAAAVGIGAAGFGLRRAAKR